MFHGKSEYTKSIFNVKNIFPELSFYHLAILYKKGMAMTLFFDDESTTLDELSLLVSESGLVSLTYSQWFLSDS
jgi:hypothetical protein